MVMAGCFPLRWDSFEPFLAPINHKMTLNEPFLARTDALANALRVNVEDLVDVLDVSRSSLFGWRAGRRKVSNKAWAKLEAAEREAGIGVGRDEEPERVSDDHVSSLLELMEKMKLPDAARREMVRTFTKAVVCKWRDDATALWREAGAAATVLERCAEALSGDLKEEAEYFARMLDEIEAPGLRAIQSLSQVALSAVGETEEVNRYDFSHRDDSIAAEEDSLSAD